MKNTITIILLITTLLSCKAQDNTINLNELTINNTLFLGNNVNLVTQQFGQPNSIEDYYYEMDEVMSQKYNYNGILFYIIDNKVDSFEVTGNNYTFTNHNLKIGDNIQILQPIFPLSYSNRSNHSLVVEFNGYDRFFVILFNNNNLITKIRLGTY